MALDKNFTTKRGVVEDGLILVFAKYQSWPKKMAQGRKRFTHCISITPKSVMLLFYRMIHCSSASSQTTAWRESVMMLLLFGVLLLLELEKTVSSVIRLSPPLSCRQNRWLGRVVRR